MRKQPQLLKIITDAEVDRTHETSLAILEEAKDQIEETEALLTL